MQVLTQANTGCPLCALACQCPIYVNQALQSACQLMVRRIWLKRAEVLCAQIPGNLYVLLSGSLKIYKKIADNKQRIVQIFLSGGIIGFDQLHINQEHYQIVALQNTEICEVPLSKLLTSINSQPQLQYQLLKIISRSMVSGFYVSHRNAEARVAGLLCELSGWLNKTEFIMPLSRQEIGNYLGLSAETVSRILVKMQNEQLITFDKRHICLRNLAALQNQSQMLAHENI